MIKLSGYSIVIEDYFRGPKSGKGALVRLVAVTFFIERTGNRRGEASMKFENSNQRWRNSLEGDEVTGVNGRLSRGWRAGYRGEPSRGNFR